MFEDGVAAYERDDYPTALRLLRPLAEYGHSDAQSYLAGMYANGEGVPQDYVSAHMWFTLAAAQGDETAQRSRDIVAKLTTPGQIAEAQFILIAREWMAKHQQ